MSKTNPQHEGKPIKVIKADKAPEPVTKRGRPAKYPFNDLEVGDCFKVPSDKVQSVRQSASNRNMQADGKQFTVSKAADGEYYCYRKK